MGVPKFYRWISERYPNINQLIENASKLPEFDNLYLDLNGVIHANTHPANRDVSEPLTEREMMLGIFRSLDRMIFEIAKPKKLVFIAVDGVAPRAKLNQQR
jgi:5'-3' exoribonuclease 1